MWHLEPTGAQARNRARKEAQAGDPAIIACRTGGDGLFVLKRNAPLARALLAARKEELEPQADAQEGNAAPQGVKDGRALTRLVHVLHGALEAPHAGKHQARGSGDVLGRVRDDRLASHGGKAVLDGEEIALVVVDDDDLR